MLLTYKYRLLPTSSQHKALLSILASQRDLYNAALEERIDCYRKFGRTISYIDQSKSLTECRRELPEMAALPVKLQRGTLKRLDEAFRAFFRRIKARDGKAGFPRFRGEGCFNAFEFIEMDGLRFDGKRLRFKGMPSGIRVHLHRPMPNNEILTAKFKRDYKGWCVCLSVRIETPEKRIIQSAVGIDVGIKTLAATSDGLLIPNPRAARRAARELRVRQRALARCMRGSNRRRKVRAQITRLHAKIANTRSTSLHQISAMLVRRYDVIAVEALNVKGLSRSILARDVQDAGWPKLVDLISYKAERAGKHLIKVDPKYTSQTCPECGTIKAKTLAERVHECACGYVADRDVAAARVILSRAGMGPGIGNVGQWAVRRSGNLTEVTM